MRLSVLSWLALVHRIFSLETLKDFDLFPVQDLIVAGSYDGISFFPSRTMPPKKALSNNSDAPKIFSQYNDTMELIGVLGKGQTVHSFCTLTVKGRPFLYVGGALSQIGDVKVRNIAYYDIEKKKWFSVADGVDDKVVTLACDNKRQAVFIGGHFKNMYGFNFNEEKRAYHDKTAGGIIEWNHSKQEWNPTPFKGVDGHVENIILRPDQETVIIGGNFKATQDGWKHLKPFSNPVDLKSVLLEPRPFTPGDHSDVNGLLCGQGWDLPETFHGNLRIQFYNTKLHLSGIRLYNRDGDNGLKKFQVFESVSNKNIKMSKVVNEMLLPCNGECELEHNDKPQDFVFEDIEKSLDFIELKGLSWYGDRIGLQKLELFSYNSVALIPRYRGKREVCKDYKVDGNKLKINDSDNIDSELISNSETIKSYKYTPKFSETGYYRISTATLQCSGSYICYNLRYIKYSISPIFDNQGNLQPDFTRTIQINNPGVPTKLYTGYFIKSSNREATITISYPFIKEELNRGGIMDSINGINIEKVQTGSDLNGLLEYDPRNYTNTDDHEGRVIDIFPQLKKESFSVMSLAATKDDLFAGGISNGLPVVIKLGSGDIQPSDRLELGFSGGHVNSLALIDNTLVAGGSFNVNSNQKDIHGQYQPITVSNVAKYDIIKKSGWVNLGTSFGAFKVINFYPNPTNGSVIMVGDFASNHDSSLSSPRLKYLEYKLGDNSGIDSPVFISGSITAVATIPSADPWTFFAGEIDSIENTRSTNVGYFRHNSSFIPFPATSDSWSTSIFQSTQLNTGLLYSPQRDKPDASGQEVVNSQPVLIVGGQSHDSGFFGMGIYELGQWSFIDKNLRGSVRTIQCSDDECFIGGQFDGGDDLFGLAVWSFKERHVTSLNQPIPNKGKSERVNKLVRQPSTTGIIVGGKFSSPDFKSACNNLCVLDADLKSWASIGKELPSDIEEVIDLVAYENRVVIIPKSNNPSSNNELMLYDVKLKTWTSSNLKLPAPPTYISYDNTTKGIFISGKNEKDNTVYLRWWNEGKDKDLGNLLQHSQLIKEVMVLINPSTSYDEIHLDFRLPSQAALLVSGDLYLDGYGECTGALFDGSAWQPYFTTSRYVTSSKVIPGQAGVFARMPYFPRQREYLSTSLIILISLAIALGILFVIIGLGLLLLFLKHKRRQESRQALIPLLSDVSPSTRPVDAAITTPLASPINAPRNMFAVDGDVTATDGVATVIPMSERNNIAHTSSSIMPDS